MENSNEVTEKLAILAKEARNFIQTGMTSIVISGKSLTNAKEIIKNDEEFTMWSDRELGNSLSRIANNIIRLHAMLEAGDGLIPVPLASPQLLLELANKGLPLDEVRASIVAGELIIEGTSKPIENLDMKDISWYRQKVKDTLHIAKAKDTEIKEKMKQKNGEIAMLQDALRTAKGGENESRWKNEIAKKNAEIARLKKDRNRAPKKLNEKYRFLFKAGLQQLFISEAASYYREFATPEDKAYIADLINGLLTEVKAYKEDIGI